MSTLTDLREAAQAVLTDAGLRASDSVPERVTPPFAWVSYGSPMLETGDTFCTHLVRLDVSVIASKATNAKAHDEFDELLTSALAALIEDDWTIERVDEPVRVPVNNAEYLGTTITITTQTQIS